MRTASSATLGSRRHRTTVHEDDMPQHDAKVPKHGLGGRRALGDITNAVAGEGARAQRAVKKTASHTSVASFVEAQPAIHIDEEVAEQPEMQISEPTVAVRPYMQRDIDDIDDGDTMNPSMATVYVNDMYECLREAEQENMPNPSYMSNQPHINTKMRAILVDWLVKLHIFTVVVFLFLCDCRELLALTAWQNFVTVVPGGRRRRLWPQVEAHSKFKMHAETLFLAIWIIDKYLELRQVRRSRLQLVGITALLVRFVLVSSSCALGRSPRRLLPDRCQVRRDLPAGAQGACVHYR